MKTLQLPQIYSRISEQKLESPWFRPPDQEDWRIWFDCAKVRK